MTELKITAKKGTGFYIRAAATFLRGTDEKPPVPSVILSGTGSATTTVVETAHAIQKQGLAKITRVETGYPTTGGQSTARLAVTLTADWPFPDPSSYCNFDEVRVESYALDLEINFEKGILQGSIELELLAIQESSRLVLDTRSLSISRVTADGASASFQLGSAGRKSEALGEALEIELPKKLSPGEKAKVHIEYATAPDAVAIQILSPEQTQGKKHPYLFTQCQAIHARCLMPCQDTPGVKSKYTAKMTAPSPLTVLMSAVPEGEPKEVDGKRCFYFTQKVPIPSYLLAIACGNLASRRLGPRSHVWSEPEAVEACAFEFSDTEKFMSIGEKLFGEYVWGIYDLLVLPPSFPYGGMENPCLTFVTPTLLAGDRSLADVVAHEITHSWFGNLCTNRSWECFWLNEGFTKFGETRIMGNMNGADYEQLLLRNDCLKLSEDVALFGPEHEFTKLCPQLKGVDPDDAFSGIPYMKGELMLRHLEKIVGQERFEAYLRAHVKRFSGGCLDENDFKNFFLEHFSSEPAVKEVDWQKWFYGRGMPEMPALHSTLAEKVELLFSSLKGGYDGAAEDIKDWFPKQTELLLDRLVDYAREQAAAGKAVEVQGRLNAWNEAFGFDSTKNAEIRFRWLMLALACNDPSRVDAAIAMAQEVGRMKFTRPLYRELIKEPSRLPKAKTAFEAAKGSYHPHFGRKDSGRVVSLLPSVVWQTPRG
ncbi:Leucine aminopeptidase (Epoxide hydrolase) (Leukotriene A-4 hydrolase homolog) (LTA-4 hydrolase) [Durusdinium trenchii]|uniref:Leucine aminopeptidase (Epoxide hydrolase) (Leukotriene A-4 hydrolase homolog) (LTA-4 hydrolase) n=1 Tax=Durusdinium trenchii TaxID=1381693 RepID=A0ABP0SAJ8_9DINO